MIRYADSLTLTGALREQMRDDAEDFPFEAIETDLAWFQGRFSPWHWHEYAELGWTISGAVECHTPDGILTLRPGEGYFVNAGVLHANHMAPGCEQTRFRVIQFSPRLFAASGLIARKYVRPLELCAGMKALALYRGEPQHRAILERMETVFELAKEEPEGWELSALRALLEIWSTLYGLAVPVLEQAEAVGDDMSLWTKAMLGYIHAHYGEPITVDDIARAASISPRETYRAFRKVLGTTPALYLSRHRVNVAARMLRESDRSVSDIAMACGFSTPNYFCKVFRDVMGKPPRDYRRG